MQRLRTARRSAAAPRFLDPKVLARIGNLELLARTVVEGFMSGLHRSRHLGVSLDFAEHRAYMPGDDIRRIDWRLYARTDRYHVKEFEADTNASVALLLDVSRSMRYAGRGIAKLDYARYLVACLAHLSHAQRDRVGLATLDGGVVEWIPPSGRRLDTVLHALERADTTAHGRGAAAPGRAPARRSLLARLRAARDVEPDGPAEAEPGAIEPPDAARTLAPALTDIAGRLRRRGVVILVSDLYEPPVAVRDALRRLRYGGHDVVVFHVLDPTELDFSFDAPLNLRDLESGARIPVVPDEVRERYRERVRSHIAKLSRLLAESRVDYTLLDTGRPLDHALFAYLSARSRRSRVR